MLDTFDDVFFGRVGVRSDGHAARSINPPAEQRAERAERRRLRRDLAEAVRVGGFQLQFQLSAALGSGRATGAEALLRWPHRRRGLVLPGAFVPMAEQCGLMGAVGGWALTAACAEAINWPDDTAVSVNVSPSQLVDATLLDQVAAALVRSGLAPERLVLELTERLLLDVRTETLLALSAIRDLGVGLALDDFGTGFASLGMLKRLPLTALKLDRSLVHGLPTDREDAAIVRAVIATGHALGLTVTAEGIETEAQRGFLAGCGCDEGQGWLLGRPASGAAMRGRLSGF